MGEILPRSVHFLKPGAMHQVRWMANNIYAGKMYMFSKQMGFYDDMVVKLMRMNVSLAYFYTPAWLKVSWGADVPIKDLQFIHDMIDFRSVDEDIADVVINKLCNHLWYLSEEVAPFASFSKHPLITHALKKEMADQLLLTPVPENFRLGKPIFKKIGCETTLTNLIGPESHSLFHILKMSTEWLFKPVEQ